MTSFSLRQVKLRPGEQYRDRITVELPAFEFGGERYVPVPDEVPADFDVTRANTGTVFSLSFTARLHGPCYRCLGDAVLNVPIQAREYHANTPDGDEELTSPYLENDNLDLSAMARDAVALSLPETILCGPDCAGICAECGKNLNDEPHVHEETAGDPRWAALEALRDET